jgi:hypothetical protein
MANNQDKSMHVLRREYGKLKFGDFFYIKWIHNNFVFCNGEGKSLYNDDKYSWENQVFILSSKLMDKPVVLLGGAKFMSPGNRCAGMGIGFGAASEDHYGYDNKSYAIYCYKLPVSDHISKLFLIQKNSKLTYVSDDKNALWKATDDIRKIPNETLFKVTLTKLGWNINSSEPTLSSNQSLDICTHFIACDTNLHKRNLLTNMNNNIKIDISDENMLLEPVAMLENLQEFETQLDTMETDIDKSSMSKYEKRLELINKFALNDANSDSSNINILKKQTEDDEKIIDHRQIVIKNK